MSSPPMLVVEGGQTAPPQRMILVMAHGHTSHAVLRALANARHELLPPFASELNTKTPDLYLAGLNRALDFSAARPGRTKEARDDGWHLQRAEEKRARKRLLRISRKTGF